MKKTIQKYKEEYPLKFVITSFIKCQRYFLNCFVFICTSWKLKYTLGKNFIQIFFSSQISFPMRYAIKNVTNKSVTITFNAQFW